MEGFPFEAVKSIATVKFISILSKDKGITCNQKSVHGTRTKNNMKLEKCPWEKDVPAWCPLYHTMLKLHQSRLCSS